MTQKFLWSVAVLVTLSASFPAMAQQSSANPGAEAQQQSSRNPGTASAVSWDEVMQAAQARFEQLDVDHDGTLSQAEAEKAGITPEEFKQANTKGKSTLSEEEYVGLVEGRFQDAKPNSDQTLSRQELSSPAGQNLVKLLDSRGLGLE